MDNTFSFWQGLSVNRFENFVFELILLKVKQDKLFQLANFKDNFLYLTLAGNIILIITVYFFRKMALSIIYLLQE